MSRAASRTAWIAAAIMLVGCGSHSQTSVRSGRESPDGRVLYVSSWAGYLGKQTIPDFESATGIRVFFDTFDTANTLEALLMAGDSGYDLVTTSTDYFSREIKAGVYRPLDRGQLTNWGNLDPDVLTIAGRADPGNRHAVPYLHAILGFAYNVDMIRARMPDAPVDSLDMVFRPEIIRRFADCGITFVDTPSDVLPLALRYLGLDPNSSNAEDYEKATQLVLKVRPYIRAFDSNAFESDLMNKELCIAMCWASNLSMIRAAAQHAGLDVNLAFTVPREGANITYDALLIPAGARHLEAAHMFINFVLKPAVIARVTNDLHAGNNNRAANRYVDPKLLEDPTIYPSPAMQTRLYVQDEANAAIERIRSRAWTRIKSGQ
jgi:putrescine transport system substrate-binding protein